MKKNDKKKRSAVKKWGILVFCLCLAVAGGILLPSKDASQLVPLEDALAEARKGATGETIGEAVQDWLQIGDRVAVYLQEESVPPEPISEINKEVYEKIYAVLDEYRGELYLENAPGVEWQPKWHIVESQSNWYYVKGQDNLRMLIREDNDGTLSLWSFAKFSVDPHEALAEIFAALHPDATNYTAYTEEDIVRLIYKGNAPRVVVEPNEAFENLMGYFRLGPVYNALPKKNLVHGVRADSFTDDFSGAYVDGENLVILIPESLSAEEAEQSTERFKRWLRPEGALTLPENIVFESAEYTYRELAETMFQILDYKEVADGTEEYAIGKCGIDDRNNRVVVYMDELDDAVRGWFAEHVTDAACVEFREAVS